MERAEKILKDAQARGIKKFYALVSGGKDSITAALISNKIISLEGVIFIDTTIGLRETREFVEQFCKEHGLKLLILKPKTTYEDMVMKYGFPGPSHHRMSFIYLKWQPLYYWLKEQPDVGSIGFISGVRRKESRRRLTHTDKIKYDPTYKKMVWIAPIVEWSTPEVWEYIKERGLPISPAYKTLHISGDCLCGAYSKRGEAELISQFYPELAEKIRSLEAKCPNRRGCWGNQSSMKGAAQQQKMESWLCADCEIGEP